MTKRNVSQRETHLISAGNGRVRVQGLLGEKMALTMTWLLISGFDGGGVVEENGKVVGVIGSVESLMDAIRSMSGKATPSVAKNLAKLQQQIEQVSSMPELEGFIIKYKGGD